MLLFQFDCDANAYGIGLSPNSFCCSFNSAEENQVYASVSYFAIFPDGAEHNVMSECTDEALFMYSVSCVLLRRDGYTIFVLRVTCGFELQHVTYWSMSYLSC